MDEEVKTEHRKVYAFVGKEWERIGAASFLPHSCMGLNSTGPFESSTAHPQLARTLNIKQSNCEPQKSFIIRSFF